mgnify:CR=1 FL=1
MRTPASALACDVDHEAAYAAAGFCGGAPVVVVGVVAALAVALGPEFLDECVRTPTLEGASTFFDAFYGLGAWERGFFRVPDRWVEGFLAGGPDCARGEVGFAGGGCC